jgi:NAD(P)-dependent dehydrogenase (short-subunit alcohol dehydrogenase family)
MIEPTGNVATVLTSFRDPLQAVVIGASGGIGRALVDRLAACPQVRSIVACSRAPEPHDSDKVVPRPIDILDERSIEAALAGLERIDLAIVATGRLHAAGGLHPEKTWRALEKNALMESYAINAVGPALIGKSVLPRMPRSGKAVFAALSARVGSISDNQIGGWYAYRASKAALNQLIRTFSIELARQRKDAICVGLHPGTVDSALSRPFQAGVAPDRLFSPAFAAKRLLAVVDALDASRSGHLIAWDGRTVAP